ncbi:EscU/YscU/HrcU family type III secretion system export apparatus switch protein [Heliophilum fasciatum]|uniref:Flagellar biosynthesis protein n=1 Tax=Heliophilum fasciatum TaxID=35700 RepID=A0A4R2RBN8_9FIRM|nr:EscU/YscU/HrcU family type III secretion system export apparatus switch protein [Heliophilum fasciatum]MCW2279460.1 flagellar biosynthesis protein [Heliophilum fasciatum]TCP59784.1 flagellar biosynthesis protein [Heliophilum fasciatum]
MAFSFFNQKRKKEQQPQRAAAIHYDPVTGAPTVIAQGHGQLAQKIIDLAKEKQIPLQENPVLVEHLMNMDLGDQIPPQLYLVVAEILLMIETMENQHDPYLPPVSMDIADSDGESASIAEPIAEEAYTIDISTKKP